MTKQIPLANGRYFATVDDEDYEYLSQFSWTFRKGKKGIIYAYRRSHNKYIHMHRVILHAPDGVLVDHIDINGLNNTRKNLRLATDLQNSGNQRMKKCNSSGYKGVSKKGNRWNARIQNHHIGYFLTEVEAAIAYDNAAIELFGEYAYLNFPIGQRPDIIPKPVKKKKTKL